MQELLVNRLGGLSLPRKSVFRLTDRPDMTSDVYCGCKTITNNNLNHSAILLKALGGGGGASVSFGHMYLVLSATLPVVRNFISSFSFV